MTRVAVLASGSGTNLQAILDHQSVLGSAASAHVVLVASDHADAGALTRARDAGVTAVALDRTSRTTGLSAILAAHRIELVALADAVASLRTVSAADFEVAESMIGLPRAVSSGEAHG